MIKGNNGKQTKSIELIMAGIFIVLFFNIIPTKSSMYTLTTWQLALLKKC